MRTREMLAWAGRRLGRAWEEAAENQKEGRSWAGGVHQARQESWGRVSTHPV